MWSLKPPGSTNRGFTLIELVIAIGFAGILCVMLFSLLNISERNVHQTSRKDDFYLNGRYAAEYIIEDVYLADEIVSMESYYPGNIQAENTLGFILIKDTSLEVGGFKYRYIYYRLTNGTIYRSTYNSNYYLPSNAPSNGASNFLIDNVTGIGNTSYLSEDLFLTIEILLKNQDTNKEYLFMESRYLGNF